ncbi:MAG: hypothetical protein EOP49_18390 [Sphingobacteriales bacterium]|nr:MAG: hypothetical protein EOP49_18390 [Sphingobacteriales bacterium]
MRKFFTSLLLLVASSGQLLFAETGAAPNAAPKVMATAAAAARPMLDDDVRPLAVIAPTSGCDKTNSEYVTIRYENLGSTYVAAAYASFDLIYPDGSELLDYGLDFDVNINPNSFVDITFPYPFDMTAPGTYTIRAIVVYGMDTNPTNDTIMFTIVNAGNSINTFPYIDDFEGPSVWASYTNNPAVPSTWQLGTPTAASGGMAPLPGTNNNNAWITNITGNYSVNEQSYIYSPCFDFTGVDPIIEFDLWWNTNSNHGAKFQYTTNNGASWTNLGYFTNPPVNNWYNDNVIPGLAWTTGPNVGWAGTGATSSSFVPGNTNGWVHAKLEFTQLFDSANVRFRLALGANTGTTGPGIGFDNFQITTKPNFDLVAVELVPFQFGCGLRSNEPVSIRIYNNSINKIVGYAVGYTITDVAGAGPDSFASEIVSDTIYPFTYYTYTFNQTANLLLGSLYDFTGTVYIAQDEDNTNDIFNTSFINPVNDLPKYITFENGLASLEDFAKITRSQSRILVNAAGAYGGSTNGMIMDGGTQTLGWSDFDALTKPFEPNNNSLRYSSALLCVRAPDSLQQLKLSFYLNQLYHGGNFLWTNFRVTVNGVAIPVSITDTSGTVSQFVPAGNQKAIRPDVSVIGTNQTGWKKIEANLMPYVSAAEPVMRIGFESSTKFTYNYVAAGGTANLIDSIMVLGSFIPLPPDCALDPYHPDCPCGQTPPAAGCCPDPFNPNCIIDTTSVNDGITTLIKVSPNPSSGDFTIRMMEAE